MNRKFRRRHKVAATLAAISTSTIIFVTMGSANAPAAQAAPICAQTEIIVADGVLSFGGNGLASAWAATYSGNPQYNIRQLPYIPLVVDFTTRQGTNLIKNNINQINRDCPNSKIYIIAHSAGALAAGNAISELADEGKRTDNIKADLIADGRRSPGADGYGGIETWVPNILPRVMSMSGERENYGNATVRQTTNQYDGISNLPKPWQNPIKFIKSVNGYLEMNAHVTYPPQRSPVVSQDQVFMGPGPTNPQLAVLPDTPIPPAISEPIDGLYETLVKEPVEEVAEQYMPPLDDVPSIVEAPVFVKNRWVEPVHDIAVAAYETYTPPETKVQTDPIVNELEVHYDNATNAIDQIPVVFEQVQTAIAPLVPPEQKDQINAWLPGLIP